MSSELLDKPCVISDACWLYVGAVCGHGLKGRHSDPYKWTLLSSEQSSRHGDVDVH